LGREMEGARNTRFHAVAPHSSVGFQGERRRCCTLVRKEACLSQVNAQEIGMPRLCKTLSSSFFERASE
jgi:hypothetical protein